MPQPKESRAWYVADADAHLIDAATRLVDLMSNPTDAALLAPLVIGETCEICRSGYPSKCVHAESVSQTIGTQAEVMAVLAAKQLGAERIIAMSRHPERQKLARFYGATDLVAERGDAGVARSRT